MIGDMGDILHIEGKDMCGEDEDGRGGVGRGCEGQRRDSPLASELFNPVYDEAQAKTRRADG